MQKYKLLALSFLAAMLAGCGGGQTIPDPDPTDTVYNGDSGSVDTDNYNDSNGDGGESLDDPFAGELAKVIYFDFDSSEVRGDFTDVVSRHALHLANNPSTQVRLEGHADERGSREYNIGLGERRSQSVRRMLLIQGASASQISTVSFGEERPAAMGSSEADYAENRRVEIRYLN